jgi:phosphatidylglycerophosphatase A
VLNLSKCIASGFGSGYAPKAPGTFGSLAAVVVWLSVMYLFNGVEDPLWCLEITSLAALVTALVGYFAVKSVIPHEDIEDPQWIVIDEWAGMLLALVGVSPGSFLTVIVAFLSFRLFDASKVWLVGDAEGLPGATGIMVDDLIAGFFALGTTQILFFVTRAAGW